MFPLGDASRRPRDFPIATATIVAANALGFALELAGGDDFVAGGRMAQALIGSVSQKLAGISPVNLVIVS